MKKFSTIDEYIESFPENKRRMLTSMRQIVEAAAPQASQKISYGMPYYSLNGRLVYFAAFKDHVSLFSAASSAVKAFSKELKNYETSKGTIRFPLDKPLPLPLIRKMVEFRVRENEQRKKK